MKKFLLAAILISLNLSAQSNEDIAVSPKEGWDDVQIVKEKKQTTLTKVLLYLPNRILDFIDIFRADVGAGFSNGAVVRVSKYVQAGYRDMDPNSFRIGLFGREAPYLNETSSEFGISPFFTESKDRNICSSEVGLGADVIIVGAYGGICLEEVADFIGGIFMLDFKKDDLE